MSPVVVIFIVVVDEQWCVNEPVARRRAVLGTRRCRGRWLRRSPLRTSAPGDSPCRRASRRASADRWRAGRLRHRHRGRRRPTHGLASRRFARGASCGCRGLWLRGLLRRLRRRRPRRRSSRRLRGWRGSLRRRDGGAEQGLRGWREADCAARAGGRASSPSGAQHDLFELTGRRVVPESDGRGFDEHLGHVGDVGIELELVLRIGLDAFRVRVALLAARARSAAEKPAWPAAAGPAAAPRTSPARASAWTAAEAVR